MTRLSLLSSLFNANLLLTFPFEPHPAQPDQPHRNETTKGSLHFPLCKSTQAHCSNSDAGYWHRTQTREQREYCNCFVLPCGRNKISGTRGKNSCVPFVRIEVNLTIPAGTKGTMPMLRVEFALRCSAASQPCQPAYDAATFDASTSSDLSTLLQILHRVPSSVVCQGSIETGGRCSSTGR